MVAHNLYDTEHVKDMVLHADNLGDFTREILPLLQSERVAWSQKIKEIITDSTYSKETFASLCRVSRQSVSKWCDGALPSSREDYIRIGFAAHYSLNEMNAFLQRYGKYSALYAKSLEDTVLIFVLSSPDYPHTYAFCEDTIDAIKNCMGSSGAAGDSAYSTVQLSAALSEVRSLPELMNFIEKNAAEYRCAYARFYAYVIAFLMANNTSSIDENMSYSVNFLANEQGWSSSLRQCVSAIRQKKWIPLRRKVIALGLHLNMTTEQINEMLRLAQMEPLCAKNPVECAIIYAVEDADLNGMIFCDGGTELCEHVRATLETLKFTDVELLLNDLGGTRSHEKVL